MTKWLEKHRLADFANLLTSMGLHDLDTLVLLTEQDLVEPSFGKNAVDKRRLIGAIQKLKTTGTLNQFNVTKDLLCTNAEVIKISDKLLEDVKSIEWVNVSKLPNGKELYNEFVVNFSKFDTALELLTLRYTTGSGIEEGIQKLEKKIKVISQFSTQI